jgi:hypothetical protein
MEFDSSAYGYFFEAVAAMESSTHAFRLELVMSVPWGWQIIDGNLNSFGWVIQLWDGRRLYLEYTVDEAGRRAPEKVTARPLAASEMTPALSDPAVHWFEPRHLNAALTANRPR